MQNQTIVQFFHWYYNEEENLWIKVVNKSTHLKEIGITSVWLPPAYKAGAGQNSVGYDVYDLFDMGEFDQKGSVGTKYGTRAQYIDAISALHDQEISVLADVVFNHKAGGDELERITVKTVDENDRTQFTSENFEIEGWTKFTFPGRGDTYSNFIWDYQCFSGIDWAEDLQQTSIYSIQNRDGEDFQTVPSKEFGNYDYLMFNDIDFRNKTVRAELKYWGEWLVDTFKVDGFRLDAVKHISPDFIIEWIDHLNTKYDRKFFIVAENWEIADIAQQEDYIRVTDGRTQIFDSLLHRNFYVASKAGENYDMSTIFDNTLVQIHPELSVTFVDNHDSQPLQALESYVEFWFRPIAHALTLLRLQGIPCLFFPDIYGAIYEDKNEEGEDVQIQLAPMAKVELMSKIRSALAYGEQRDYFDHQNCIGWTRTGSDDHEKSGLAVVLSNGGEGIKAMEIGQHFAGKTFIDALGHVDREILVEDNGWAEFHCNAASVSVWILKTE